MKFFSKLIRMVLGLGIVSTHSLAGDKTSINHDHKSDVLGGDRTGINGGSTLYLGDKTGINNQASRVFEDLGNARTKHFFRI